MEWNYKHAVQHSQLPLSIVEQSVSYYHAPHKGQSKAECELLPRTTQGTVEGRV